MKKIVTVIGARPQFVKAAVLSRIIAERGELKEIIIHTGQHFDKNMSEVFFEEMEIPVPKYNLEIQEPTHGAMTGKMLEKIEKVLMQEKPDGLVVYGDTNSTLAGALAAKKLHIPIAHVEAGLRSFNTRMPEEINRIITDRISDVLFCPTEKSVQNLKKEGFDNFPVEIIQCGDIMKDAVSYYSEKSKAKSKIMGDLHLKNNDFVLATIHRQETTDDCGTLKNVLAAMDRINSEMPVVMPLHPRTRKMISRCDLSYNFKIVDPLGYFDMLSLLHNCKMVLTDSGGLQKEAFFNKKHCLITRNETEWVELVDNDFAAIVGTDPEVIYQSFQKYKNSQADFSKELYGNRVGEAIYEGLKKMLM